MSRAIASGGAGAYAVGGELVPVYYPPADQAIASGGAPAYQGELLLYLGRAREWNNGMEQWNRTMEWNNGMEQWNGTMEWNNGMEQWNGTMEWNNGMEQWNGTEPDTQSPL